jgi:peptidoglycan hydrolase-like protein with peptidoglycan-binding domain
MSVSGANPFFSPNGAWVAVWNQPDLVRAPVDGGEPVVIATTTERPLGGTWARDDTIVYATTAGLYRVPAQGGELQPLVKPDRQKDEKFYAWPQFLPGERYVLFTIVPANPARAMQIALLDMQTLEISHVLQGGSFARYAPTGHLVFATGSGLKIIPFDLSSRKTLGEATAFPDVELGYARDSGAAEFALSAGGTLVFLSTQTELASQRLVWVDRHGKEEVLPVEPRPISYAQLSPDGMRVALDIGRSGSNRDIWILDLRRLTTVRLTDGPTEDMLPVWSPDGRRVYFASDRSGNFDVYSQSADGSDGPKLEFASPGFQAPNSVTPDGTRLIVLDQFKDLASINLTDADRRLAYVLNSNADERLGEISPDGKWLAYESNEGGNQFEIFVRPFPDVRQRREKISINGGRYPRWAPRGTDELYYVDLSGEMMAASVKLLPELRLGRVTKLFDWVKPPSEVSGRQYDVSPVDGRFLIVKPVTQDSEGPTLASVILNWPDGVLDRSRPDRMR